jgi:tryptophanyl-tRNA synthetase
MSKKRVFSGIQTSGELHLGNYIGAIRNMVNLQQDYECIYSVVDYHAITVPQEPAKLREYTESIAAWFVAAGVDPQQSILFAQSHVPQHTELGWIMTTLAYMGELERMTQFKDKAAGKQTIGVGLFTYPALMAADILLYQADVVPVGEDQTQHVEMTRNLAQRFNGRFGEYFNLPQAYVPKVGKRVMSLDDATKKMSKSNPNEGSRIQLSDAPSVIRKKIARAVTDSGNEVRYDVVNKPQVSNLMEMYAILSGKSLQETEDQFAGQMYGPFKKELAEVLVSVLEPMQQRYAEVRKTGEIYDILRDGAERATVIAEKVLRGAKERMGFLTL